MKLPKFLMADNSEFPEDLFVVHTEYPRFILNVEEEEVEWLDDLEGDDEETMADEATKVVEAAFKWCDEELAKYDEEDDDESDPKKGPGDVASAPHSASTSDSQGRYICALSDPTNKLLSRCQLCFH